MSPPPPQKVLADLWRAAGQPEAGLEAVALTGAEPALPSSFAIGTVGQATAAASALAANELWQLRTGRRQRVSVDMRHAGIEFRSERYLRIDGKPPHEHRDKTVGVYRTGDGRWIRLHTNLPHHRAGTLKLLELVAKCTSLFGANAGVIFRIEIDDYRIDSTVLAETNDSAIGVRQFEIGGGHPHL